MPVFISHRIIYYTLQKLWLIQYDINDTDTKYWAEAGLEPMTFREADHCTTKKIKMKTKLISNQNILV